MSTFVDANVLVYARDASQTKKQLIERQWIDMLWETTQGRLSTQVLNEYYVTVTRTLEPGMPTADARADIHDLTTWSPLPVTRGAHGDSRTIEDRHGFSFWDALIVTRAQVSGAGHLLTEDLQGGQDLDGVIVVDPFTHDPRSILST